MEAPAGLLRLTEGLNGRKPTLWQFFCHKDGIWFFRAYRNNIQQKLFFMLSQLKWMAFRLAFFFNKLSLLVIRRFGTDIVDLNSRIIILNSFSRFGWFTVLDFANKNPLLPVPQPPNHIFPAPNITMQTTWAGSPAAVSSDAALHLRGKVSTSLIASMLTSLGSTANSDVTYIRMDFLSGNWTATSEIKMKTAWRVGWGMAWLTQMQYTTRKF